ncbi:hypothetical protein P8452_13699 [Trifolium repens]|nr:hypothetical protein P8452_13699 [Trifolium repens]
MEKDYEKPYEETEKKIKRSRSSLSNDEDDDHDDDDAKMVMMKKQEALVRKSHKCNICGKSFSNGKALGGHRRSHFLKKKPNNQSPELKTPSKHIRIENKSDWNGDDDDQDESDNISDKKLKTSEGLCESRVDKKPSNHSEEQKTFNFDLNEPYVMED